MIEMKIAGVAFDFHSKSPLVILKDANELRSLPIAVGGFEMNAIVMVLENMHFPRPLTHDLLQDVMEATDVNLEKVVITELKEGTFFAKLVVRQGNHLKEIDARPSDSIALALRFKAPIFATEEVIANASMPADPGKEEVEAQEFHNFVTKLKPDDFNKFIKGS